MSKTVLRNFEAVNSTLRNGIIFFFFLLSCFVATGQKYLDLKTGTFPLYSPANSQRSFEKPHYFFYSSDHVLSNEEKIKLEKEGVEILYALKGNVYWVRVKSEQRDFKNLSETDNRYKQNISIDFRSPTLRLRLSIAPGLQSTQIMEWSSANHFKLIDIRALSFGLIDVEIQSSSFDLVLNTPWVSYIESVPKDEELNYRLLNAERGWGLISPLMRGLNGSGMTVGIGDGGRLGLHEDLANSTLDLASFGISNHAMQVTGIVTGSGLLDPAYGFGYAPHAKVLLRNFSDILWDAPQYIEDYQLSLTNNSYSANPFDCAYIGDYTGTSTGLDAMINDYPHLLHVFAAGNSGTITCSPYPFRYATIAGGYQSSKNVLTVGAISITDAITNFSSRGPVDDGRLKPEVVAYGFGRFSTINNNNYGSNSGTSFSSPATMGMATLLYERYRQLHNDSFPDAALIKNVICNGADDLGNTGPDFQYGFGRINGVRSVEILESESFDFVDVNHNSTILKYFNVPSGVASVDVMLTWSDYPSAPYETVSLVNDLDLIIVDPSGDTIRPWNLNYTPSGVTVTATTGSDHSNNYEQVTVQNVEQGTYTIVIKGFNVPMGPQGAWVSWDMHQSGVQLQSPIGGEVFRPGIPPAGAEVQYIRWDAFGTGNSTFSAEYSINGGSTWTLIAGSIPSQVRYYAWYIPNIPTDEFRVRITASNGMTDASDDDAIIMAPPFNITATSPCDGYLNIQWSAAPGADYYQVYHLKNEILTEIDTTSGLSISLGGFPVDEPQWITVAGVFASGTAGLRARAILATANGGNNCTWNDDLRLDSLVNPVSGRTNTSTSLNSGEQIQVYLTNAGLVNASGFKLSYQINNNLPVTESYAGILNAGNGQYFTFIQTADLSAPGLYNVKVWSTYNIDPFKQNDTILFTIQHLPNPPVTLPWSEGFEPANDETIIESEMGIAGLSGWDAVLEDPTRMRTFAGSPFCHTGENSLTMDAARNVSSASGELLLTVNFQNYTVADDDIRMSLHYMHHEIIPDINNTEGIWIRGSDADTFVFVTFLNDEISARGIWQFLSGLEISKLLSNANQDFSSSFQVKFPFMVNATAGDPLSQDGQTIDDISFQRINRDIKIDQLFNPEIISCGLGVETIEVSVMNTSDKDVLSTSISYQVNDGTIYTTNAGTIPMDTSLNFFLSPAVDFSIPGTYNLTIWVSSPTDDFHENDTFRTTILHTPLITDFPYREGFEDDAGGWVAGGVNSTWTYGSPGKTMISRAAEGQKAWTTSLTSGYNADEMSYLYSPCFDLDSMTQPYLSFAFMYQLETDYDYAWVEYRLSGSDTWAKLGTQGSGTNWYNDNSHRWSSQQTKWMSTGISIPFTDTIIQFRWVLFSDVGVEFEGVGIDQVHVYDQVPIYTGSPIQLSVPVNGNDWVHIDQGGQRIFSIHPQGQDLGNVTLTLYSANQNFLFSDSMYLLSRNWVLSGAASFMNAISLRSYFTISEANNLVSATGCSECISSRDGFDVGVVRYSGVNEDGLFNNNTPSGVFTFSADTTEVYPYANGYYAEWSSDSLSEWWISSPVTKQHGWITRRVSSSGDDAEEHQDNGSVNPWRETLTLTDYEGHQKVGWRFKNITIPAGSYISSAVMKWTAKNNSSGSGDWIMRSELSPDANGFTTDKYDISLRPKSNLVAYASPSSWTNGETYNSPEIKHLIQNVIDQADWMNGNDLVLIMTGNGVRESWSYDGDPLKSAELIIRFENLCTDTSVIFVDQSASGNQDGTSWTNAYKTFEQALDRAAHCSGINQIWIADGIYKPYADVPRDFSYTIPHGLSIYGGFQGNEVSVNERIYGAFPTFLSGDIGLPGNQTDNLFHVVSVLPGSENVIMDGIHVSGGMSNGTTTDQQTGSAIYNRGKLYCNQVILEGNSPPSLYNGPGSELISTGLLEIRD